MSIWNERPRSGIPCFAALLVGCTASYDSRAVSETALEYLHQDTGESRAAEDVAGRVGDLFVEADLDSYVRHAITHHHGLQAAFERWRAAAEEVGIQSGLPDPRVTFGEFLEEVQTRTGPQRRTFGLSQAFPWPGTLDARARTAAARADVLRQELDVERLRVATRVALAFHEYAFLGQEIEITRDVLQLVRGLEPVAQARVRAGAGQEDLLRLQVEIGRLEDGFQRVQERRRVLSARLGDAMNLPADELRLLPFPSLSEHELNSETDREALLARALEDSPRIRILQEKLRAARCTQELSRLAGRPDFSLGVNYIQTGDAPGGSTRGSGDDPLLLTAGMDVPLWQERYAAERRRADHGVRAVQADLAAARSSVRAELEEVLFQVSDATRRTHLYRGSLLPRAREAVQLTTTAYRAGSATILDLLDSERALLEFELNYQRAIYQHLQGRARLLEIIGADDSWAN